MGGQEATAPVIYGDWRIIRWVGGQYALQIGRGWTRDQWDNYAQRLVALSDWERSPEGIRSFNQKLAQDMGVPFSGNSDTGPGMGGNGNSRPCYIVQDQINRVQNDINSNIRALNATSGSVWSGGVQGVLSQNRQRLVELQNELTSCTR
jgi:hypothetical protein